MIQNVFKNMFLLICCIKQINYYGKDFLDRYYRSIKHVQLDISIIKHHVTALCLPTNQYTSNISQELLSIVSVQPNTNITGVCVLYRTLFAIISWNNSTIFILFCENHITLPVNYSSISDKVKYTTTHIKLSTDINYGQQPYRE